MEPKSEKVKRDYLLPASILIAAVLVSVSLVYNVGKKTNDSGNGGNQANVAGTLPQAPSNDWSFVSSDPALGPANAKVTVVEFADFQCPYCGIVQGRDVGGTNYDAIRGTTPKLIDAYVVPGKVRFVYHVMAFLGQESVDSANAALCAREIGGDAAFFKMHDVLFGSQKNENQGDFSKDNLKKLAVAAGFSTPAMVSCIDSGKYNSQIAQSTAKGNAVGVQGTPTFAINNQVVPNGAEYATLKQAVDALLQN